MDYFEHKQCLKAQKQAEDAGRVADSLVVRMKLISKVKAGEITLEEMQSELKRINTQKGRPMCGPVDYEYVVDFPGELAAGLHPFTDKVTVTIHSGDPGGEPKEFDEYMRSCLAEWFDGAAVTDPTDV